MASCGYHSPQFSEDIAWLPAWLQPHQCPAFGDAKDEHHISQLSCKNLASLPKNMSNERDSQLFTKWDGKYSGCHLYLSGDDNSPAGTIPSSTEALPFHLHLSSLGVSQLSTSQLREIPQPGIHETNEGLPEKHFLEIPAVQAGALCQNKAETEIPALELPMRSKSRVSRRRISPPPIKADRKNQRRLREKPNTGNICNADINDAVELSIAASEAMVISEMVTSTLQSENLPAAAILEIALRVKQARKECSSDILVDVSSHPSDELSENDPLSDLDENILADAFGDVGISLTQIVECPDNSHYSGKSLHSNPSCDLKTHTSESHFGNKDEVQNTKLDAHVTIVSVSTLQTRAALAMDSVSKDLPLQPPPVEQTKASVSVPLDCTRPCLKSQPKVGAQNLEQNADNLNPNQASSKDGQGILKDGKASPCENATMRKNIIVFNRETSFISESMDEMDERMAGHTSQEEPEIGASSSTPFRNLSRFPYRESERSMYARHNLSQDLVRSSLVDPLCSVVPCSISSEDVPISCDPYQDVTTEVGEKFMEPKRAIGAKEFNEKIMIPDLQETPLKTLVKGWPALPKNNVEVPVVASRKQFSSLRHYSTVMPDPNNCKPPSQSTEKQILQFSSAERNTMSNEPNAEISLKPIDRCADVNVSQDKHGSGSQDQKGSSVIGEAKDDDGELLIHHLEDTGPPIILNNKKRRLRACKIILNSDSEEASLENSSASKNRKCKITTSTNGVKSSNLTNFISHNPMQSSLRSHPSDKESLKNRRVRFLEAIPSVDRTKSSNRLHSKHSHASHRRSSKRVKKPSLPNKSSRKENDLSFQPIVGENGMIFLGLEFLLTGFAHQKEKELEALIRQYGGYVLINIPSDPPDLRGKHQAGLARIKLPIVLSPKKVQTTKFLYGCAANTWMLNAHWLVDSIRAGSLLPPWKFMNRLIQVSEPNQLRIAEPFCLINHTFIFERVGVMLNGKVSFCTKFSKIIKHGGGKVFKSLQRLVQSLKNETTAVGLVLVENEGNVSRHLKHCALENDIQTVPASWMVNSLFSGKLLPITKERYGPLHRIKMPTFSLAQEDDMSEEI